MHLVVNFIYEATVKHRRKPKPVEARYVGQVPVEIREATPAEAPVALRLTAPLGFGEAPEQRLELRWFDEGLYIPVFEVGQANYPEKPPCTPRDAAWLARMAEGAYRLREKDHKFPLDVGVSWERYGEPRPSSEDPLLREFVSSKDGEVAARISAQARDLLLVGGVVHRLCPEPVYRVGHMEAWKGEPAYKYIAPHIERPDPSNPRKWRQFETEYRADEVDWLLNRRPNIRAETGNRIEVLVPEAVRDRVPHLLYIRRADAVLDWMRDRIATGDRAFFDAYADLRDARTALADLGEGAASPEADAAFHRVSEAVDLTLERIGEIPGDKRRDVENARARLYALGYWNDLDASAFVAP